MATEGLNVSTGLNSGEAQVLNDGGLLNMYGNLLAKQQARRQAEQQQLANELAQIKVDGVRQPDQQEYFNKYQELKNVAAQIPYERNNWKRAQMKADVDQKFLALNQFAGDSRNYGIKYTDIKNKLLDNKFRDQFTDGAVQSISDSDKLAMNDPKFMKDFNGLDRKVDAEKLGKEVDGIDKTLLNKSTWNNQVGKADKLGNRKGYYVSSSREVTPEEQLTAYANKYTVDPNFRKYLQQTYPDQDLSNDEVKAQVMKDFADRRRATGTLSENTKPEFKENRVDNFYAHYNYRMAHPITTASEPVAPRDLNIKYNDGKSNVDLKEYVPINSAALNLAGNPAYNLSSASKDPETLSSGDHQLVGVGNVPFIKGGYKLQGTIAQPDFAKQHPQAVEYKPMLHVQTKDAITGGTEDKFVPYDRLPANASKAIKQALSNFKPAQDQLQSAKKSILQGDIPGAAAASGYSVKEYTDLLKQKGIEIQASPKKIAVTLPNGISGYIPEDRYNDFKSKHPNHIVH